MCAREERAPEPCAGNRHQVFESGQINLVARMFLPQTLLQTRPPGFTIRPYDPRHDRWRGWAALRRQRGRVCARVRAFRWRGFPATHHLPAGLIPSCTFSAQILFCFPIPPSSLKDSVCTRYPAGAPPS